MGFNADWPGIPYHNFNPPPVAVTALANKVKVVDFTQIVEITGTIVASADDSSNMAAPTYSNTNINQGAGNFSGAKSAAFRFSGITIPAGAIIANAYITFTSEYSRATQAVAWIYKGEDAQSPAAYGASENYKTRTYLAPGVAQSGTYSWVINNTYNSPDLSTIIQALVNKYTYNNGKIAILWDDNGTSGTSFQVAWSYDSAPAKTAVLHIFLAAVLTNKYLFQYRHVPVQLPGYFYVALLDLENIEAVFSINGSATFSIEVTRLAANQLTFYYDSVFKANFPQATSQNTVWAGYYDLSPAT